MLAFTENKKKQTPNQKREEKKQAKDQAAKSFKEDGWASSTTQASVKPAWHDEAVDRLQVRLEDTYRLRKLKKEEAEQEITGQQYAERLQDFYTTQLVENQDNDIFSWAKAKPAMSAKKEVDLDPISLLLKSNARVFEKQSINKILKAGENRLDYSKLANANTGFYHQ